MVIADSYITLTERTLLIFNAIRVWKIAGMAGDGTHNLFLATATLYTVYEK